jgi:hypothetical protein
VFLQSIGAQADITASLTNQLANERYHFEQGNQDEWRKALGGALSCYTAPHLH